jgi:hypothetical protein
VGQEERSCRSTGRSSGSKNKSAIWQSLRKDLGKVSVANLARQCCHVHCGKATMGLAAARLHAGKDGHGHGIMAVVQGRLM